MGAKMTVSKYKPPKGEEINRNSFEFKYVIGKGGFGKVWKVVNKKNNTLYALKEMQKVKVIDKKSENSIKYERELLSRLHHPFIVNMYYAFQDANHLYIVMDLLTGGDLRYHISRYRRFSEEQTKFFIACIVLSLEYIHSKNVIHRDIKPENLVLDDKGYVRLTDFGIAKVYSATKRSSFIETSGTPGYMAPEVMNKQHHSMCVDYFALGVIGYEFMLGKRPYVGKSRKEIKDQMTAKQVHIRLNEVPNGWSEDAADFLNRLLLRKPEVRLGSKGIEEIKQHPWLKYFPWDKLYQKQIEAPFIPEPKDNFDKYYCECIDKINIDTKMRYEHYRSSSKYKNMFVNFTYYGIIEDNYTLNQTSETTHNETTLISTHSSVKSRSYLNIFEYYKSKTQHKQQQHTHKTLLLNNNNNINRSYVNSALIKSTRSQLAQLEKSISSHLYKRNTKPSSYAKASSSSSLSLTPRNKSSELVRATTPYRYNNNKQHQRRSITPLNAIKRSQTALNIASYADKSKRKKLHTPKHISASSSATTSPNINRSNNIRTPTSKTPIVHKNSTKQSSPSSNRLCCLRRNNISNVIISNETPINKDQQRCCAKTNKMFRSNCNRNYNCGFIKQHNVNKLIENLEMSGNTHRRSSNNVNVNVVVINNGIINVSNSGSGLTSGRRQSKGSSTICGSNTSYSGICTNNNMNMVNQRKRIKKSNSMRFLFENYKMDSHMNVNKNKNNMSRHSFVKHK